MRCVYTRIARSVPLRPYLKIFLRNQFSTTSIMYGLVDSCADYSIFPYDLGVRTLRLDLRNSEIWNFQGTTGKTQIAYLATVEVNVLGDSSIETKFQFAAKVGFCEDFKFGGGVLLGQDGFMSLFK